MRTLLIVIFFVVHAGSALAGEAAEKAAPEKLWFVGVADKPKGPMSAAAVEKLIEKGELDAATLAWQDGMAEWQPLSEIARFRSLVVTPPPLPKVVTPPPLPTKSSTSSTTLKAKPPPMPSMPPIVMTPPPLPATPPAARRVIGAMETTKAPPLPAAGKAAASNGKRIKLIVAAPDEARAWAEQRLNECDLSAGAVGVVRVLRGVVSVSSTPTNACVSRVLATALTSTGVSDEEPFEIIVDDREAAH